MFMNNIRFFLSLKFPEFYFTFESIDWNERKKWSNSKCNGRRIMDKHHEIIHLALAHYIGPGILNMKIEFVYNKSTFERRNNKMDNENSKPMGVWIVYGMI